MILLDYKDRRPIYEQVMERLQELMACGVLPEDSQLPSVRSLATELSINPNTIQRAYAELERDGYIYSVKGKGSFVADHKAILEKELAKARERLSKAVVEARTAGLTEEDIRHQVEEALRLEEVEA